MTQRHDPPKPPGASGLAPGVRGESLSAGRMLDCRGFRHEKLADPYKRDEALARHAAACPPCAGFAARLETFEHQLRDCVDCDVPPDLGDRILAQHATAAAPRKSWFARLREALGGGSSMFMPAIAGFGGVLALGIGGVVAFNLLSGPPAIAHALIVHVQSEPEVFALDEATQPAHVQQAFAALGGSLAGAGDGTGSVAGSLGRVRHLGTCVMDGKTVQHLLVETDEGQATLVLIPGDALEAGVSSENGMSAAVIPLPRGSVGIVTRSPQSATKLRDRLRQTVREG